MGKLNAVTAAAGAGKTTRIVGDIAGEIAGEGDRRAPESLLATTFTIKAADELVERARAKLFETGEAEAASRLLGARFGTVNAVCGQIVAEFALDLGRSPSTAVIGEGNEALAFSVAADGAIGDHAAVLNRLADAFGYNVPVGRTAASRRIGAAPSGRSSRSPAPTASMRPGCNAPPSARSRAIKACCRRPLSTAPPSTLPWRRPWVPPSPRVRRRPAPRRAPASPPSAPHISRCAAANR